ncbi:MAG: hypothetical protein Tsb0020_12460 [Haliangiales bacterium]
MVRPDENESRGAEALGVEVSGRVFPAGGSPVPVSAEAPGRRPRAWGEISVSQARLCRRRRGEASHISYLHVLDATWQKHYTHLGVLVRYADDFVIMARSRRDLQRAEEAVHRILGYLQLQLHPDKARSVDLSWGKQGFDFLGCHLRKRLSGPIWERSRRRVYFLQRWPSQRSMKRARTKRPPVSRVRENRTHGLKGSLVQIAGLSSS